MPRQAPTPFQDFLSSVVLPLLSFGLLPISLWAVSYCTTGEHVKSLIRRILLGIGLATSSPAVQSGGKSQSGEEKSGDDAKGICNSRSGSKAQGHSAASGGGQVQGKGKGPGCVIISGGRMTKGLTLARAFKLAGWTVIGVEERGWGELCPLRFSSAISAFHLLPPAASSYSAYSEALQEIAITHQADLFIPVSGAGSSVEDSLAADEMYRVTKGKCRTFIQDPETMLDLHDKDRFMALVDRLGMKIPEGKMVESVQEALLFLQEESEGNTEGQGSTALGKGKGREPKYILKCMGLDENRGDMTLFPLQGDDAELSKTRRMLEGLRLKISKDCPYVFQEYIPGQEWCTHASVIRGHLTSFVAAPSNDMLMTYENGTSSHIGHLAEEWTKTLLAKLRDDPIKPKNDVGSTGNITHGSHTQARGLTGHFSFDFIVSTKNGELYPIECNARVHTAVILLPLSKIASCYDLDAVDIGTPQRGILRPLETTRPRSWLYNDIIMRYLPRFLPLRTLAWLHPSLPACHPALFSGDNKRPSESPWTIRIDPTLVADDWVPFLVLWHVYWPYLLLSRWWKGKKWTRLNVSTGRIFEA